MKRKNQLSQIFWRINIFLSMGTYNKELIYFKIFSGQHIRCKNFWHVMFQNLLHMRASFNNRFRTNAFSKQITSSMFRQDHIYITQMVQDFAVQLFWHTLIKTTIARLHVKNRNLASFCCHHS